MNSTAEQEYAKGNSENRNRAMSPKLGSKEGTNRDATRGASADRADGERGVTPNSGGYSMFGDASGRNDDTFHKPDVKSPSKPTLGDY